GIPGNIPTIAITTVNSTNMKAGIIQRLILVNAALRSFEPIRPKLSNNIVNDQPKAGLTKAEANTTIAADCVVLPSRVISIPASSSGINTPTISATHITGSQMAKSIG